MASSKKRSFSELLEAELEMSQLNEQSVTEGQAESENLAPAENDKRMEDLGRDWQVVESRRRKKNKKRHNKEEDGETQLSRIVSAHPVHEHQEHVKKVAGKNAENEDQASARQVVGSTTQKEGATRKKVPKTESSNYPSINFKNPNRLQSQLKVSQLQELVLNILADGTAPQWIEIAHKSQVRRVVVLMVRGLEREMFEVDSQLEESLETHVDAAAKSINVSKEGIDSPILREDLSIKEVDQLAKSEVTDGNGASELPTKAPSLAKIGQLAESRSKENGRSSASNQDIKSPDFYIPTQLLKEKLALPLRPLADMFPLMWPVSTRAWRNREQKLTSIQPPIEIMLKTVIPRSNDKKKAKNGPQPPREEASWINQPTPVTNFLVSPEELRQDGCAIHPAMFRNDEDRSVNLESRRQLQQTEEYGWMDTDVERWDSGDAYVQKGQEDSTPVGEDGHGKENGMQLDHPAVPGEDENRDIQRLDSQKDSLLANREVFAIDCEMCMTGSEEFAVTRVSVVSWSGEVILDDLVKPEKPIIDYVTEYSGITEAMLDPITTTLHDVQVKLKKILHPGAILCGHAIANDLMALKMTHPFLVDSAYIYPHLRGFPYKHKLSYLATKYLNRSIQAAGGRVGHDSIEDARAALDLIKMKCEKGPAWGTLEAGKEDIFKRLSRTMRPKRHSSAVTDEPRTGAIVDWPKVVSAYSSSADVSISCRDDDDVVEGIKTAIGGTAGDTARSAGGVDFVWARLRELEVLRGWTSRAQLDEDGATNKEERSSKDNHYHPSTSLAEAVSITVKSIEAIYHDLPPCTAFIVYSGSGDPREMQKLQATERKTDEETAALEAAVSQVMQSIAFITVK